MYFTSSLSTLILTPPIASIAVTNASKFTVTYSLIFKSKDVFNDFRPNPGKINFMHTPGGMGVRIDTAVYTGYEISPFYDSMILKIVVSGQSRLECIRKMRAALEELIIDGVKTTIEFHYLLLHNPTFVLGNYDTTFVETFLKEVFENAKRLR